MQTFVLDRNGWSHAPAGWSRGASGTSGTNARADGPDGGRRKA
ncbi:hypothetical protein [Kribbella deserti]|uniref:Uncharacterized protein n=1 Tax=Kribbella deserti TaxID=1926257 RepID=A0ABV6QT10_9ACTN